MSRPKLTWDPDDCYECLIEEGYTPEEIEDVYGADSEDLMLCKHHDQYDAKAEKVADAIDRDMEVYGSKGWR